MQHETEFPVADGRVFELNFHFIGIGFDFFQEGVAVVEKIVGNNGEEFVVGNPEKKKTMKYLQK